MILFVYMSGLVFASPSICLCWFECLKCLSFSVWVSDFICLHVWADVCKSKNFSLLVWMSKVSVFSQFTSLILFVCMSGLVFASPSICLCWFVYLKCISFSVYMSDSICLHVRAGVYKSKYLSLLLCISKVPVFFCLHVWFYLFACLGWCLQVQVFVFVGLYI